MLIENVIKILRCFPNHKIHIPFKLKICKSTRHCLDFQLTFLAKIKKKSHFRSSSGLCIFAFKLRNLYTGFHKLDIHFMPLENTPIS